jgi:hypothetical protein
MALPPKIRAYYEYLLGRAALHMAYQFSMDKTISNWANNLKKPKAMAEIKKNRRYNATRELMNKLMHRDRRLIIKLAIDGQGFTVAFTRHDQAQAFKDALVDMGLSLKSDFSNDRTGPVINGYFQLPQNEVTLSMGIERMDYLLETIEAAIRQSRKPPPRGHKHLSAQV